MNTLLEHITIPISKKIQIDVMNATAYEMQISMPNNICLENQLPMPKLNNVFK